MIDSIMSSTELPDASKSAALKEEDEFMNEHGSIGCCMLYRVVEALAAIGPAFCRGFSALRAHRSSVHTTHVVKQS